MLLPLGKNPCWDKVEDPSKEHESSKKMNNLVFNAIMSSSTNGFTTTRMHTSVIRDKSIRIQFILEGSHFSEILQNISYPCLWLLIVDLKEAIQIQCTLANHSLRLSQTEIALSWKTIVWAIDSET